MCNCNVLTCGVCKGPKGPVPRKHAEVIKAWADGATIQMEAEPGRWIDCLKPAWFSYGSYRIKPTPKPLGEVASTAYSDARSRGIVESTALWAHVSQAVVKAYKEQQQ
jgi:hypothetical protein